ncbi:MAG: class I SAM-dependent methyltransferase [Halieaceae bacterium]|jgi:SAM-dependent methyltransferase|nr:class I SAM-dependent methyltransferase [Halieaceae bacterium]
MEATYDRIGSNYQAARLADSRIFEALQTQLCSAQSVLNIGAGTGSYEPPGRNVVALEPSSVMIAQRPESASPVVQGYAEALPFRDNAFDVAMGVLTLHHWNDWERGLAEAARVAGGSVVLLTWIGFVQHFWLADYFPEIEELDNTRFPSIEDYQMVLGEIEVIEVPIPQDCTDGFMCAYWQRPNAYLDPQVRNSISTFAMMSNQTPALGRLEDDLATGRWHQKYGELLSYTSYDYGYRIIKSSGPIGHRNSR